jgi:hypothetical protein
MLIGVDPKDAGLLELEMELVRNDRLLLLENKIGDLSSELKETRDLSKASASISSWKHLMLRVISSLETVKADETQKLIFDFVSSIKQKVKLDPEMFSSGKIASSKIKKMVKKQLSMVEKHEQDLSKREERLFLAKQQSKAEIDDWNQDKEAEWQAIAQERGSLQTLQEKLWQERTSFEIAKQELENTRTQIEERWQLAARELAERENMVNARFPELSEIETYISNLLQKLDASASKILQGISDSEEIREITDAAMQGLSYAKEEIKIHELKSIETLKLSQRQGFSGFSERFFVDIGVQCSITTAACETTENQNESNFVDSMLQKDVLAPTRDDMTPAQQPEGLIGSNINSQTHQSQIQGRGKDDFVEAKPSNPSASDREGQNIVPSEGLHSNLIRSLSNKSFRFPSHDVSEFPHALFGHKNKGGQSEKEENSEMFFRRAADAEEQVERMISALLQVTTQLKVLSSVGLWLVCSIV